MGRQIHIIVKGRVQGVCFRDYTKRQASNLGLKGTVKNLADGSVEIYAEGAENNLEALRVWCWEGSPYASVDEVIVSDVPSPKDLPDFRVVF